MNNIKYLRVIVNNSCNLSCFFCHREGEKCGKKSVPFDKASLIDMLQIMKAVGIRKIKFLGGEPTLCQELPSVIEAIRDPNVDISMITNGVVDEAVICRFCKASLNRINVSLHGFDSDMFHKVTGGSKQQLVKTFNTIKYLQCNGKLGKINYVLLKGVNEDEFYQVLDYVVNNNLVLDVLNYLGDQPEEIKRFYYSFDEIARIIQSKYDVSIVEPYINQWSLPSTRLSLRPQGIINLKTAQLNSINYLKGCSACNKRAICVEGISAIRLSADGVIKPCIFRDDNIFDLKKNMESHTRDETVDALEKYFGQL